MMMMSELVSEMLMLNKLVNMVSGQRGSAYKVKVFQDIKAVWVCI